MQDKGQANSVRKVIGYALINRQGKRFFSSPPRPYRLWDPPTFLPSEYRGIFSEVKTAEALI